MELPEWKSHKIVRAAKILDVKDGGVLVLDGLGEFHAGLWWMNRNNPCIGDYYVEYTPTFAACSRAEEFEAEYGRACDG